MRCEELRNHTGVKHFTRTYIISKLNNIYTFIFKNASSIVILIQLFIHLNHTLRYISY